MKYYLKKFLFLFVYVIMMDIVSFGAISIQTELWVRVLLSVLSIAMYLLIVVIFGYAEGKLAEKALFSNDNNRRFIIETGKDIPLKEHEEFKAWKGFVIGASACFPMILGLIVHLIVYLCTGTVTAVGGATSICYMLFYAPIFAGYLVSETPAPWASYFIMLYGVVATTLAFGISYIAGAAKMRKEYDKIREKQKTIYGEQN